MRAELNESRTHLITKDNLIKDLQHQLAGDTALKNTNDEINRLNREIDAQKNKITELNKENSRVFDQIFIIIVYNFIFFKFNVKFDRYRPHLKFR